MNCLTLSIIGFKNYKDEIGLNTLIVDTVQSLFEEHHESVMLLLIKGADKSNIIERICHTNGFGYRQYYPEWNRKALERWELNRPIKSHRTGHTYNACAPLNRNRKILRESEYVILLNDINNTNDSELLQFSKILKYDKPDKYGLVTTIQYDSTSITSTTLIDTIQIHNIPF